MLVAAEVVGVKGAGDKKIGISIRTSNGSIIFCIYSSLEIHWRMELVGLGDIIGELLYSSLRPLQGLGIASRRQPSYS